jgi:hypothetical protein
VVSAPSITRPNSDIVVTGWVGVPDNTNLYANIDEAVPSTTDYILSPDVGASPGPAIFGLSSSLTAGSYDVRFEAKRTQSTGQIRVVFRDSSGVSVGASAWQTLTNAYTTYALTVSTTGTATQGGFEVQP